MSDPKSAQEALLNYTQADMDGTMVLTSRQAIHEVCDEVDRLRSVNAAMTDALETLVKRTPFLPSPEGLTLTITFEQMRQHRDLLARAKEIGQ